MAVKNPKELFVALLSNVRQGTEHTNHIFQELTKHAQRPEVKEALEARILVDHDVLGRIDEIFKVIGEKPMKLPGRLHDAWVEDFREELAGFEHPLARHLFILAKANHLYHLRIAEYTALVELADVSGHYVVGALLETCLADKVALAERTRRLMRHLVQHEVRELVAA